MLFYRKTTPEPPQNTLWEIKNLGVSPPKPWPTFLVRKFPSEIGLRRRIYLCGSLKVGSKLLVKYRDKSRYFGTKYKITHKPSLKGKVANRRFDGRVLKPSPLWRRCWAKRSGWGVNPLIKVLIKRIKFNFFQMEKWDLQELFYRKSSLHLQKSL